MNDTKSKPARFAGCPRDRTGACILEREGYACCTAAPGKPCPVATRLYGGNTPDDAHTRRVAEMGAIARKTGRWLA